jgi:hypothetical protein
MIKVQIVAEYKFICIADTVPQPIAGSKKGIEWSSGDTGTNCPGGGVWEVDTGWLEPLTMQEGSELTAAIILVWLAGWGARQIIRVIRR